MKKILSILILSVMLMTTMGMVSAVSPTTLFSNGFESGNFNGWSQHDNDWYVTSSGEHSGTYAALTCDSENDVLRKTISTSGYENIVFSYWYRISQSLGDDDHVYAEWYDGSSWHEVAHYTNVNSGDWTHATFNLPSGAKNNPNFQIRFRSFNLENCCQDALKLDDVLVTGIVIFEEEPPVCGNQVVEDGEECDDGNTEDGDGCSSTCQIEEEECVLIIDEPTANDWFDSQAVPIEWHLEGDCESVVYFHLYYHKSSDGTCDRNGNWYPIITNLGSGLSADPEYPEYSYLWNKPSESGQYCVYVEVHSAGKKGYSEIFNVDLAKPEVSLSVGTPQVGECGEEQTGTCYVNQNTEMTLSCTDNTPDEPWQSGVDYIEYQINGGGWQTYSEPFTFSEDSNHVLEYRCYDNVGKVDTESKNFVVESVGPEFVSKTVGEPKVSGCDEEFPNQEDCDYYVTQNTEICVSYEDPLPHPVDDITIYCEATVWETLQSPPYNVQVSLDGNGCFKYAEDSYHELHCWAVDALGNREESEDLYEADIVDTLEPETEISFSGPYYADQFSQWINSVSRIILTAVDPEPHPVDDVTSYYRYEQVSDSYCEHPELVQWEPTLKEDTSWIVYEGEFGLPESCYVVEYYSEDALGNSEDVNHKFVFSDHTAPELFKEVGKPSVDCSSLFSNCEEDWDWKVTRNTPIKLSCEDQLPHPSGVKELCYRIIWDGAETEAGWSCISQDEVTIYFQQDCEHTLEFYCVDNVGKTSETDSEVFKVEGTSFEIPLEKKWNLISVPFNLLNTGVEEVFNDISEDIEGVWAYEDGEWKVYSPSGPSDLTEVVPGHGYWVKTTADTSLLIGGSLMSPGPVLPSSVELDKGWNLIGRYGTVPNQPAYCALFSLVDTQQGFPRWSALWGYNAAQQSFMPLNQWSITNPGEGYWVEMDVEDFYSPSSICYGFQPLV